MNGVAMSRAQGVKQRFFPNSRLVQVPVIPMVALLRSAAPVVSRGFAGGSAPGFGRVTRWMRRCMRLIGIVE